MSQGSLEAVVETLLARACAEESRAHAKPTATRERLHTLAAVRRDAAGRLARWLRAPLEGRGTPVDLLRGFLSWAEPPPAVRGHKPGHDLAAEVQRLRWGIVCRIAVGILSGRPAHVALCLDESSDLGITLVELFAFLADVLEYRQDRVENEAYLAWGQRPTSGCRRPPGD